jgi:hypothetical protein
MARLVKAGPPPGMGIEAGAGGDDYKERVAKYIPAEIISGYLALSEVVKLAPAEDPRRLPAAWALFLLGLALTPIYLWFAGKPSNRGERFELGIAALAFVLWAYALGGPFEMGSPLPIIGPYAGWIGALLVGVFTWVAGLYEPKLTRNEFERTRGRTPPVPPNSSTEPKAANISGTPE